MREEEEEERGGRWPLQGWREGDVKRGGEGSLSQREKEIAS